MKEGPEEEHWEVTAREYDGSVNFEEYEEIEDTGRKCVETRWVLNIKDAKRTGRLVAKGFMYVNAPETAAENDSPTCSEESIRGAILKLNSLDVKVAFLQVWPWNRKRSYDLLMKSHSLE